MAERSVTKEEALAIIQAGRRELGAEALWLRRKMNPKRIATDFAQEHTTAMVVSVLVAGVAVSWLALRKWNHRHDATPRHEKQPPHSNGDTAKQRAKVKVAVLPYLTGLLVKSATPWLIKNGLQLWQAWESSTHRRATPHTSSRDLIREA